MLVSDFKFLWPNTHVSLVRVSSVPCRGGGTVGSSSLSSSLFLGVTFSFSTPPVKAAVNPSPASFKLGLDAPSGCLREDKLLLLQGKQIYSTIHYLGQNKVFYFINLDTESCFCLVLLRLLWIILAYDLKTDYIYLLKDQLLFKKDKVNYSET